MILRTRIFGMYKRDYKNITELAKAMGVSTGYVYKVREGKRGINHQFIIGTVKAFPGYKLDDLFYVL